MMIALTPRIPICRTAQYFNPHFRKGSDRAAAIYRMPGKYFNPHFRKGSDRGVFIKDDNYQISIHTSAREVTKYGKKAIYHLDDFNPHFRKGSDSVGRRVELLQAYFNPHFRKGSDQGGDKSSPNCDNFNPHFRKGSDS